jgi:hypothetical protein
MMSHNFLTYGGQLILQIIGEILYFPFWWYSVGLARLVRNLFNFGRGQETSLGLTVWIKNIFVPMYGQRDIASRIISFVMRLVQIILRGTALLFWILLLLLILAVWLLLPPFLFMALTWQITH